ncbi:MAG: Holliday junction resolvase RecU [Clostridiales bacterium]|nr:Holliday junction resolvase RecU [Clostridiales bacterium]
MALWKSRGLRGSMLEEMINITNSKYREKKLALIQKIPTPITPISIDKENKQINLAYFDKKSTVDYIGVVQGIPICFDAKECAEDTFSLNNIHEHQIEFMKEFEKQEGIAFLIIYFKKHNLFYYMTYKALEVFWKRALDGGRKSFRFDELDLSYEVHIENGVCVHYLEQLNRDLVEREKCDN